MKLAITDRLTLRSTPEGAAVPFAVKVYTDTAEPWVLVVPTTLRYRIDDPEYGNEILAWTTVTPASSATITVTGTQNAITGCAARERRRLTVQADDGLSTACVETRDYFVVNGYPL
jgi:hypothetical protein